MQYDNTTAATKIQISSVESEKRNMPPSYPISLAKRRHDKVWRTRLNRRRFSACPAHRVECEACIARHEENCAKKFFALVATRSSCGASQSYGFPWSVWESLEAKRAG